MNKAELTETLVEKMGFTKKVAGDTITAITDIIADELANGGKVQLVGFGTFETRKRAARKGRNPQTNEEIKIPAATVPAFKAGKALKAKINN